MDEAAVVAAVIARFLNDLEAGETPELPVYLAAFPGFEAVVAREFEACLVSASGGSNGGETTIRTAREAPAAGGAPAQVGRYRILRELARGGQGEVYLAEDLRLPRKVALKLLRGLGPASDQVLRRFRREAEVASRLAHPGICTVFDSGVENGVAYIAMQWIDGESLARHIADLREAATGGAGQDATWHATTSDDTPAESGRPTVAASGSLRDRARILDALAVAEKAARALHAAHEAGIVHRDVKPGNIMLAAGGEPVILDFGLAYDQSDPDLSLTQTGDVFGTPAYMSPEQCGGTARHLDRRTDVWSLGVALFEWLTLQRPFEGATRALLFDAIQSREPPDARRLNPALPADLKVVLATALEKDRDRRYQTALDLAEELRRVRESRPIVARPAGPALRLRRWARRNRGLAVALAAAFLLLAGGLAFALALLGTTRRAERAAAARSLGGLLARADALWPARAAVVPAMERWLAEARALLDRADEFRRGIAAAAPGDDRRQDLDRCVAALPDLAARAGEVARRRDFALELERRVEAEDRNAWARVREDIVADPAFGGLRLAPRPGLVPLGKDGDSRLWEFWHVASGERPRWEVGEDGGRARAGEESGIVLVLVPGGAFRMGAQSGDPDGPNFDHGAVNDPRDSEEGPVHEIHLAPYFLAKHEMTQAQWLRAAGANPSYWNPGSPPITLRHPVENVSWEDCAAVLARLDLRLPTEAQWERACRAGSTTPWSCGDDPALLPRHANFREAAFGRYFRAAGAFDPSLDDGWGTHAPVGSYAPNAFGLHDLHGNVWEWCEDRLLPYDQPVRAGDGLREGRDPRPNPRAAFRVGRGGSASLDHRRARSAYRGGNLPGARVDTVGVRPAAPVLVAP